MIVLVLLAVFFPAVASALDFADFDAPCDGVSDAAPAWNAAIAAAKAGPDKTIRALGCNFVMLSQPAKLDGGVQFIGQGPSWTGITCRVSQGICVQVAGLGTRLEGVYLNIPRGYVGTVGLFIKADNDAAAGYVSVRDVVVTSLDGGQWLVPIYLTGEQRTAAPAGLRAVTLENVRGFNGTYACAILWGVPDLQWPTGNCYQGAGTTQRIIIGGPDAYTAKLGMWYR